MTAPTLLERRFNVLGRHAPLFYERPIQLVRGEGVWVYDNDGKRYLDAYNNVPHVGHCHPRVVDALCRQARILNTHTRYLDETVVNYAEQLVSSFQPGLKRVFFTCTGSEANELALRIARECTGHAGVISTAFAYHGNTAAVAQLSSVFTPPEQRGRFVRCVPVIDPYRERGERSEEELTRVYVQDLERAIDDFARDGVRLAAVLFCTALSSEGLPDIPRGYLARVAQIARAAGGVFIADEVQAGFGRFGSHMWGHDLQGARPDIVTLGKPMGNGHPLAGVVTTAELMEQFTSRNMYFNTFGGNEVSAAVGLAVLDVLRDEQLLEKAQRVGEYTLAGMHTLKNKHAIIGDVRGRGMFFAVELVADPTSRAPATARTKAVVNAMRDHGVLISRIGPHDNILKIRPPMCFSTENADLLLSTLDAVLSETA